MFEDSCTKSFTLQFQQTHPAAQKYTYASCQSHTVCMAMIINSLMCKHTQNCGYLPSGNVLDEYCWSNTVYMGNYAPSSSWMDVHVMIETGESPKQCLCFSCYHVVVFSSLFFFSSLILLQPYSCWFFVVVCFVFWSVNR